MVPDVFQGSSRAAVLGLLVFAVVAAAGCSDGAKGDTAGGSGSGGAAGVSSSGAGAGGATGSFCRVGSPTDGTALLTKLAGSYSFAGRMEACDFNGATLVSTANYGMTLSAKPPSIVVSSADLPLLFSIVWDDADDVACANDLVESLELNDGTHSVRVVFLEDKPSSLTLGTCVFILH